MRQGTVLRGVVPEGLNTIIAVLAERQPGESDTLKQVMVQNSPKGISTPRTYATMKKKGPMRPLLDRGARESPDTEKSSAPAADTDDPVRPANRRPRVPAAWKKGPEGPLELIWRKRKKKGAPRGSPAAPPRPSPRYTGRAPSTGQRRPALPRADPAVPSALGGLASGFGMGPGVPRPPWPLTGGRRSSLDDENASHARGEPLRVPWGPHSELNGSGIPIDLPELHPPSTCSCARGDATGKSSGD